MTTLITTVRGHRSWVPRTRAAGPVSRPPPLSPRGLIQESRACSCVGRDNSVSACWTATPATSRRSRLARVSAADPAMPQAQDRVGLHAAVEHVQPARGPRRHAQPGQGAHRAADTRHALPVAAVRATSCVVPSGGAVVDGEVVEGAGCSDDVFRQRGGWCVGIGLWWRRF